MADDDTGASGIDHYEILRDGTLVGTSTTTSFDDGSVPRNGSYGYTVRGGRPGRQRQPRLAQPRPCRSTPPSRPPPDDVTGITPTKVPALSWQPRHRRDDRRLADRRLSRLPRRPVRRRGDDRVATSTASSRSRASTSTRCAPWTRPATSRRRPRAARSSSTPRGRCSTACLVPAAQRSPAAPVEFNVAPRDVLSSPIAGEASWDFGDGSAVGNTTKPHLPDCRAVHDHDQRHRRARQRDHGSATARSGGRAKGGVPPKKLRLAKIPTMALKTL